MENYEQLSPNEAEHAVILFAAYPRKLAEGIALAVLIVLIAVAVAVYLNQYSRMIHAEGTNCVASNATFTTEALCAAELEGRQGHILVVPNTPQTYRPGPAIVTSVLIWIAFLTTAALLGMLLAPCLTCACCIPCCGRSGNFALFEDPDHFFGAWGLSTLGTIGWLIISVVMASLGKIVVMHTVALCSCKQGIPDGQMWFMVAEAVPVRKVVDNPYLADLKHMETPLRLTSLAFFAHCLFFTAILLTLAAMAVYVLETKQVDPEAPNEQTKAEPSRMNTA